VEETGDIIRGEFISDDQRVPSGFAEGTAIDFEGQWIVTGGTGRFVNASGTVNFSGSSKLLLSVVSGRFIITTARHTGVIDLK
jgi:hypothetical protein